MFLPTVLRFRKLVLYSGGCHPERSEGSQLSNEPRLKRAMKFFGLQNSQLLECYLELTIPRSRPLRFPPASPAQLTCSLPPCSSPAGSLRKILRAPAPPFPTPRC